jgi:hypothetical protein
MYLRHSTIRKNGKTHTYWRLVRSVRRGGKPVSGFAADHGLDPQRVYLWRRRLGGAEPTTFQELIVRPAARRVVADAAESGFEIVLASGDLVRVPPSFDGAALHGEDRPARPPGTPARSWAA